jgi:hypothetical protein
MVHCSCRPSAIGVSKNSLRLLISEMLTWRIISDSNFISIGWELDELPLIEDPSDSWALCSSESLLNLGTFLDFGFYIGFGFYIYCYYSSIFLDLILGDTFGYRAISCTSSSLWFRLRSSSFFYISLIAGGVALFTVPLWPFVGDCSPSCSFGASFFTLLAEESILIHNMAYLIYFLFSTLCLDSSGSLVLYFRLLPGYQIIYFFSSCTIGSLVFFRAGGL